VTLTDASGAVLHTACYGPNGQDWGTTGTNPTPFAWLGGHGVQRVAVSDHLGPLYLTRYRLYSASLNRFLSADPLGLAGGLNLYAYGEGDPLSYIDPLGLGAEEKGSYLGRSFGQLFRGNYSDDVTALGTGMQVLTGVFNVDLPGDIRDNWYNLTHWSDVSTSQKIIDAVGLLPVIGALKYADEAGDVLKGGRKAANAASAAAKNADETAQAARRTMLGANGTQVTSKTTWKGKAGRIDVENPAPGKRPGQIHYQDHNGNKYLYDPATQRFQGAPASVNRQLDDPSFRQGVEKGMKYLDE